MDLHSLDTMSPAPEDDRWEAFVRRDPDADGRFVVAVETTCIYCRPTCPARRPLRRNVRFLPDAAAAERQGYRACKRCRPELAERPAETLVARVKALLGADLERAPGLDALARAVRMSPAHLQKTFRRHTGLSPREWVAAARLARWKAELRAGKPVTEAWLDAGYGSATRAYAAARTALGMSPAAYRTGGAGQRIVWTVLDTPLGALLLARTDRGLCRVAFGEDAAALEQVLREEFPAAELERAAPGTDARLRAVAAALGTRDGAERLPLDVRATAFQRRVWEALREIPGGRTASYAEVARAVGHPRAVRAVARACATNPVALAVPCHRVVHSDGSLSGYRWGPDRKRALLAVERDEAEPGVSARRPGRPSPLPSADPRTARRRARP